MRLMWLILGLGLGCDSENTVKNFNSVPEVVITSHSDGDTLLEGYTETFRGIVSDANHSSDELVARWYAGDVPLCDAATPESDGLIQCVVEVNLDISEVRLEVQDPQNTAGVATVSLNVNPTEDPTAEILSPLPEESYYSDQLILFSALIQDGEDTPDALSYLWSSSLDGDLPITVVPESSGEFEQYLGLSAGQHAITLTVEDTSGKSTTETVAVTVGGENQVPECQIDAPASESVFTLGQGISFSGMASDLDISNTQLSIQWISSIDGVFDQTTANTDGSLAFVYSALSAGNHTIQLQVEDEIGELCQDSVLLTVGTPPSISLSSPQDGALYLVGESVFFEGTISDSEDIPSDVSLDWYSDIDGSFSTQTSDSNGNISLSKNNFTAGGHSIVVTATDSSGLTDSTAFSIRINTLPTAPTVSLSPDPAYTIHAIQASASGSIDADGDPVSYSYSWTQDGNPTTYTGTSIPNTATTAGEVWTIRVTPNDGYSDGPYTDQSIVISNSLPSVDGISISPTTANNDEILTCSATVSDADQTITPTYTWAVDGLNYTGSTLDLSTTTALPNDVVVCTAEVVDSAGAVDMASASLVVENRPPSLSGIAVSPTTVYTNSTLGCTASSSDVDGESVSEDVDWQIGGVSIGTGASMTLDNTLVGVGDTVECHFTVTDASGVSLSLMADVVVQNIDPVISALSLSPATPTAVDTLVCFASASDADNDALVYSFDWLNLTSGQSYSSTSSTSDSASLDLSQVTISPNDDVQCTVTSTDPHGGSVSQSTSVPVLNSAPSFDVPAAVTPSSGVYTETLLTCTASALDPNDGVIAPSFEWFVNGNSVAIGNTYTVTASDTDVGNTVVCTATAFDSDGETATSNASVVVENTAPLVSGVSISPSSGVYNDDVLTCSGGVVDPDESLSLVFSWTVASSPVGTGSTLDLGTTAAFPSDTVTCYATAVDSSGATHSASAAVNLSNRTPTTPVVSISPQTPIEGIDDLVCTASGSVDPDNLSITYSYEWLSDSNISVSGSVVSANLTAVGEVWVCTATASDSALEATATASVVIEADGIQGTVRRIDGTWIDVTYELCGSSCNANTAKSVCSAVGKKVVSHASNGTNEVYDLGATTSCQWSISYYTISQSMASNQCLVGISNLEWSDCCGTSSWHGRTSVFGAPGSIFGHVNSSNSGYVSSYSATSGGNWGCQGEGSSANAYGSCNEYYVACTY